MNKFLTFTFILICYAGLSQSFIKIEDPTSVKQRIQKKSTETKSIIANFSETIYSTLYNNPKEAKGNLKYRKTDNLRWEHTSPDQKLLLISNGNLRMFEKGNEVTNGANNRIVSRIKNIMMQLFNGEFIESGDFKIGYYQSSDQFKLKLAPKSKRISKHMKYLELIFDRDELSLQRLTLFDTDEDKIVYSFSSIKFDEAISDNSFTEP